MTVRVAVIGPGRLGQALARRWVEGGFELLGFLGRRAGSAAEAVRFCGAGRVLAGPAEAHRAHVVLVAVGDQDLAAAVAAAVAAGTPRRCALWLHASGFHDLAVLAPLAAHGCRTGSLHPLCPIPDPRTGHRLLAGQPAVLAGGPRSLRLLRLLATRAGLEPYVLGGLDRAAYHAACALAANGATALADLARLAFAAAGVSGTGLAQRFATALARAALDASAAAGERALSGPVARGDAAVLAAHLDALGRADPRARAAHRALMAHAVRMAEAQGLPAERVAALRAALAAEAPRG
ncbi:MAG: DUF2520 domain-containing protein [Planctomycetes bacterium]|nr:DUF2520 domain-containing protein [Planctomycetota bacterium]